ncbi:hypothetical protein BBL88_16170 [Vibrio parahaemolyticus]|uniref:hypothetical protein n=1 Tax=Vibrio parahaemolyticus TaxID=670 RepID=UPI00084B2FF7|nr:hypothetical protein BBL88_16170 [Vibrio parahaemolyticus]
MKLKHNKAFKRDSCRVAFLVCGEFCGESGLQKLGLCGIHPLTQRYVAGSDLLIYRVTITMFQNSISKRLFGFLALVSFVTLFSYAYLLSDERYSFNEMDLDRDGIVSFGEAAYISDSDTRRVMVDGKACIEFFALKDGLPIKVECE